MRRDDQHIRDHFKSTKLDGMVAVCGAKETAWGNYFDMSSPTGENAGCIKCLNIVDKAKAVAMVNPRILLGESVKVEKGDYRDWKSNTVILNDFGDVVGYIRLDNGWGKKDWRVHALTINDTHWEDSKPSLDTTLHSKGHRSKWAALIAARESYDTLHNEKRAWENYHRAEKKAEIKAKEREDEDALERAELDRQIKSLDFLVLQHQMLGIGNNGVDALNAGIKALKEKRELV
jgi:hypothetical protein